MLIGAAFEPFYDSERGEDLAVTWPPEVWRIGPEFLARLAAEGGSLPTVFSGGYRPRLPLLLFLIVIPTLDLQRSLP